jgi:transcriptional regulator with XRE-family HTH domain
MSAAKPKHEPEEDDFPSRFRACLAAAGVSQADLARELGVSRAAVQYWKTGRHRPGQPRIAGIARVLGVSLDQLLGPETEPAPAPKEAETASVEGRLEELDLAGALTALRRAQPEIERLAASLPSLMDLLGEAERRSG